MQFLGLGSESWGEGQESGGYFGSPCFDARLVLWFTIGRALGCCRRSVDGAGSLVAGWVLGCGSEEAHTPDGFCGGLLRGGGGDGICLEDLC